LAIDITLEDAATRLPRRRHTVKVKTLPVKLTRSWGPNRAGHERLPVPPKRSCAPQRDESAPAWRRCRQHRVTTPAV